MSRLLVDPESKPVTLPKFNWYATPGTVTEVEKLSVVKLLPLASISDARVFDFQYIATDNEAVDISKTKMNLIIELRRKNGTPITDRINLAPINGIGHSLFQNCKIYIGDTLVDTSSDMYGYSNYFTVVLNYSDQGIQSNFVSSMYRMDTAGKLDLFKTVHDVKIAAVEAGTGVQASNAVYYPSEDVNGSFFIRSHIMEKNREYELLVPIQMPLTNQSRTIPPRVNLKFQFTKAEPDFYLMADTGVTGSDYEIRIVKAELWIYKLQLERTKLLANEVSWRSKAVKIPILREFMTFQTVDKNHKTVTIPNLHLGQVPDRILMGIVKSTHFSGSYSTNPFNFEHFNVESIDFRLNSESLPGMPIQMDYKRGNYQQGFHLVGKDWYRKNRAQFITHYAFSRGYAIYNIDTTCDNYSSMGLYYPVVRSGGILDLHLKFSEVSNSPLTIVFKFIFNNQITIEHDLSVTFDYSA
jgi:hypothetical protein